ncbi:hypothetical protein CGGC5_v006637 [Colletotrichum fructicola Nara gc5]|uniref:Uncharacterized protein n=1 Tax=Colletotrichum fructicola (strain Nara gc5) TaxID=1213859 RepID=A0A7J6J7V1_COLFN|nr:hypothetical protein CGGC5_v006637 [Colletotrichum fructicola Nara gc5]
MPLSFGPRQPSTAQEYAKKKNCPLGHQLRAIMSTQICTESRDVARKTCLDNHEQSDLAADVCLELKDNVVLFGQRARTRPRCYLPGRSSVFLA